MPAQVIDGTTLAARIKADLAPEVEAVTKTAGVPPKVVSLLVGADPPGRLYCRTLASACETVGVTGRCVEIAPDVKAEALGERLDALAADPSVHGILLQMPLPEHLPARAMAERIPPAKDVEGITAANLGRLFFYEEADLVPATAAAAHALISFAGTRIEGAECVVVGHSPQVGKPLACLLTNDLGTCTICHVGTRDLAAHTRRAEVLVVAVGKAGLVTGEMIRPGATVIDVGINRVPVEDEKGRPVLDDRDRPKYRTIGDVDFEAACEVAGAVTPVPGGVGPVTVAMLMRNTVRAARVQTR